ncbi:MAG: phage tail protein [Collinsella sp.]|nr:phage tail protein [Collinsella sp.]
MSKRFIHFNRFGAYLGELTPMQATRTRNVDQCGVDKVVLILIDNGVNKYDRIVFCDSMGRTCEWIVMSSRESRAKSIPICTVNCYGSMQELSRHFMPTLRRGSKDTPEQALAKALEGTRWSVGQCDEGSGAYSVYHQSSLASVQDIAEAYKMEVEPVIELSTDGNSIAKRSVCLVKRLGRANTALRLDYGSGLSGIDRVLSADDVVTRLYCYGKGVQTTDDDGNETGGYSRKITFADINGGKEYIQDDSLLEVWGVPGPDGSLMHTEGIFEDGDCEDKATLLAEGRAALAERSKPIVSYEGTVEALGRAGFDANACDLGDNLQMVDTTFPKPLRLSGRVLEIVEDLLGDGSPSTVKVGNVIEGIVKRSDRVQQTIDRLTSSAGSWDSAATLGSAYLNGLIDGLNKVMNETGGYTYIKPGKGLYVYDKPEDANPTMCIQIGGGYFRIADGKNSDGTWNFRTLGNGHGLVADAIVSGTISANLIKAGTIQDKSGKNYWNLDASEVRLGPGAKLDGKDIAVADAVIASVDVEYAQGTSRDKEPVDGWQTTAPQWVSSKYIWTRTKTTMQSGDIEYSEPVCISGRDGIDGAKGDKGSTGTGVRGIVEQYYLSTSATAQSGGSWSEAQPAWSKGKYIWTRSKVTWTDGSVTYTAPCLAKAINGSNQMAGSAIVSRVKLYAKNQSESVPPINAQNPELGWSEDIPQWSNGYFIWEMDRITYGDGSVNHSTPVLVAALNKANQSAYDLNQSLNDLDTTVNDLATDGVVTEAEKAAVKKIQQTIDKEKNELTTQFNSLKSNKSLNQYFLANVLSPSYDSAFGKGGSYGSLNTAISDVLKCTTKEALDSAMATYKSSYSTHSGNVNTYTAAARQAQHAIEQQDAKSMAQGLLDNYDDDLTQLKIFNRLTNNGTEQGIYMQDNKLYMNASYLAAGIIADVTNTNSWNLKTGYFKTTRGTIGGFTIDKYDISNNRLSLQDDGPHFIYDSKDIGFIGSNHLVEHPSVYGLNFNLKESGGYMSWAAMKNANDPYYAMKLTYANKPNIGFTAYALNAGCDLDMHNWSIKNIGNGCTNTLRFTVVTNANKDGSFTFSNGCSMKFEGGLLTHFAWPENNYS